MSVKICGPSREVMSAIRAMNGVVRVESVGQQDADSVTYVVESEAGVDIRKPLFNLLAQNSWALIGSEPMGASLEDIFISLTERRADTRTKKKRGFDRNNND